MIVGKVTTDNLMRVSELQMGTKSYLFPTPIMLPAGRYEVHVDGNLVEFVKVADDLTNLVERSEHA